MNIADQSSASQLILGGDVILFQFLVCHCDSPFGAPFDARHSLSFYRRGRRMSSPRGKKKGEKIPPPLLIFPIGDDII
jgi:hypothetical protein